MNIRLRERLWFWGKAGAFETSFHDSNLAIDKNESQCKSLSNVRKKTSKEKRFSKIFLSQSIGGLDRIVIGWSVLNLEKTTMNVFGRILALRQSFDKALAIRGQTGPSSGDTSATSCGEILLVGQHFYSRQENFLSAFTVWQNFGQLLVTH